MQHEIVQNARVVTSGGVSLCIFGINKGRIEALGNDLASTETMDSTGLIGMPGCLPAARPPAQNRE